MEFHLQCLSCLHFTPVKKPKRIKGRQQRKKPASHNAKSKNRNRGIRPKVLPQESPGDYYSQCHPKRKTTISKHHLIPKSRGGPKKAWNIAFLWRDKHDKWHQVFDNSTLDEIIEMVRLDWETLIIVQKNHYRLSKVFRRVEQVWILRVLVRMRRFKDRF